MTDKEFIKAYNYVEKCASRYKKMYFGKMKELYGGSVDWLELTNCGFESFENTDSLVDAIYKIDKAIRAKYDSWRNNEYYEPSSLTAKITKGEFGLEYEEYEVDSRKRESIYAKSIITGYCKMCNKPLFNKQRKTCSERCRKAIQRM